MIASKIAEIRAKKGWSVIDLSKETGIPRQTLYGYEAGRKPLRKNLEIISKKLGVPISYFLSDRLGRSDIKVPVIQKELEQKMLEAMTFTAAEQKTIIQVIDLVLDKRKMLERLEETISQLKE